MDVVLLSHDHYDHLDLPTIRRLTRRFPAASWFVPLGIGELIHRAGVTSITELDWWEGRTLGSLTITCAPAQHFSGRGRGDRGRRLWSSWCVRNEDHGLFFGGDTALHPEFGRIGAACGPFDAALLPIGAYAPRWFMHVVHMDPEEAVTAYQTLTSAQTQPCVFVPIHWGTFKLADEPMREPPQRLLAAWESARLSPESLWLLAHGETRAL